MFQPEDLLYFIELDEFYEDWKTLGLDDDDLFVLQMAIMANPKAGDLIAGTGGLRKLRFSSEKRHTGKRGGSRVCYAYFENHFLVLLCMAYDHREKDNLDAREKAGIKRYLQSIEKNMSVRYYR